jgi:protein TonB
MNRRKILFATVLAFLITSSALAEMRQTTSTSDQTSAGTGAANVHQAGKISAPQLIHSVEPQFSKMSRKSGLRGRMLVNLFIEKDGSPSNVHVTQIQKVVNNGYVILDPTSDPIAKDLINAAVDAVNQYKFKPAKKNADPIRAELNIEMPFNF